MLADRVAVFTEVTSCCEVLSCLISKEGLPTGYDVGVAEDCPSFFACSAVHAFGHVFAV